MLWPFGVMVEMATLTKYSYYLIVVIIFGGYLLENHTPTPCNRTEGRLLENARQ